MYRQESCITLATHVCARTNFPTGQPPGDGQDEREREPLVVGGARRVRNMRARAAARARARAAAAANEEEEEEGKDVVEFW